MAQRNGQAITFQGFEGGEYGIMESGAASRNPKQMFTGTNVLLYQSGHLGPRPGLKRITIASMPTGVLKGMAQAIPSTGTGPWFWVGIGATTSCNFYLVDVGAGTVSAAYTGAALTVAVPIPRGASFGNGEFINVLVQGLYRLDHNALTRTLFATGQTGGYVVGEWRQRFMATDNSLPGGLGQNRLFFSDPQTDPLTDTWPITNFYDIGNTSSISFVRPFRDGVLIGKQDGSFFYLTGVLGDDVQVRQLSAGGAPVNESRAVMLDSNVVWYMRYSSPYVSSFNGSINENFQHLQFTAGLFANDNVSTPAFRMETLPWLSTESFMVLSGIVATGATNRALVRDNDVFSYHTWGVDIDPWCASMGALLPAARGLDTIQNSPYVILAHGSDGKYYKFAVGLDRPGFTSDAHARPGDDTDVPVSASFTTPEWWDGDGHQVRVQQIIVDYRGWNTGATGNAGFSVRVDALHRHGNTPVTVGATVLAVDVAGSTFAAPYSDLRHVMSVDTATGAGGGFQVTVSGIRSCAIRSVTVVLANSAARP